MDFTVARCVHQCHVLVVPSACADVVGQNPAAVRTPLIPLVAVAVRVFILAVHGGTHLLGGEVDDADGAAVFQESHFLAVRAVLRLERSHGGVRQSFFLDVGGIGEELFILVGYLALIELPQAVAFRSIDQAASVWSEIHVAFLLGRVGNLLGGLVFGRSHIHVTTKDECYFLTFGREGDFGCTAALDLADDVAVNLVGHHPDVYLLRLSAFLQGIDATVIAVAQCTVVGTAQEAYRMLLVLRHLCRISALHGSLEHIERAVLFAQIIIGVGTGPDRIAVFTIESGQLLVSAFTVQTAHPHVTGDGRGVMLSPGIFISLLVMIEDGLSVGREADVFHRHGREHHRSSARSAHFVHLRELGGSKLHVFGCRKDVRLEQDMSVVLESQGSLVARVGGESGRYTAVLVHHIDVHASQSVAGKGDGLSVRTPDGPGVVGRVGGELIGPSTLGRYRVDVTFEREGDLCAVGGDGAVTHPCCIVGCIHVQ